MTRSDSDSEDSKARLPDYYVGRYVLRVEAEASHPYRIAAAVSARSSSLDLAKNQCGSAYDSTNKNGRAVRWPESLFPLRQIQ